MSRRQGIITKSVGRAAYLASGPCGARWARQKRSSCDKMMRELAKADMLRLARKYQKYESECFGALDEYCHGKPLQAFHRKDRRRLKYYLKHDCFPPFNVL